MKLVNFFASAAALLLGAFLPVTVSAAVSLINHVVTVLCSALMLMRC